PIPTTDGKQTGQYLASLMLSASARTKHPKEVAHRAGRWGRTGAVRAARARGRSPWGGVIRYFFGAPTGFPSGATAYQVPPTP
ncbi:hypothetical protein, partial [Streptomyces sp. NPDC003395]